MNTTKHNLDEANFNSKIDESKEYDCNYDNDYYGDQMCIETQYLATTEHSQLTLAHLISF